MPAKVITGGRALPPDTSPERAAACAAALRPSRLPPCSQRTLMLIGLSLLIAALTLFVSRKFGFTFLFLPLFFAWGGGAAPASREARRAEGRPAVNAARRIAPAADSARRASAVARRASRPPCWPSASSSPSPTSSSCARRRRCRRRSSRRSRGTYSLERSVASAGPARRRDRRLRLLRGVGVGGRVRGRCGRGPVPSPGRPHGRCARPTTRSCGPHSPRRPSSAATSRHAPSARGRRPGSVATPSPLDYQGLAADRALGRRGQGPHRRHQAPRRGRAQGVARGDDLRGRRPRRGRRRPADGSRPLALRDRAGPPRRSRRRRLGGAAARAGRPASTPRRRPARPRASPTDRTTTYTYAPSLAAAGRAAGYAPLSSDARAGRVRAQGRRDRRRRGGRTPGSAGGSAAAPADPPPGSARWRSSTRAASPGSRWSSWGRRRPASRGPPAKTARVGRTGEALVRDHAAAVRRASPAATA